MCLQGTPRAFSFPLELRYNFANPKTRLTHLRHLRIEVKEFLLLVCFSGQHFSFSSEFAGKLQFAVSKYYRIQE